MSFLCTTNLSLHPHPQFLYPNLNPKSPKFLLQFPAKPPILRFSGHRTISFRSPARPTTSSQHPFTWLQIAATSAVLFFGLNVQACLAASSPSLPANTIVAAQEESTIDQDDDGGVERNVDNVQMNEDKELNAAEFENWKLKTFALSVPLRIVALRGSVPPSWIKDFIQSQGRRLRFRVKYLGSLENIFSDMSASFNKHNIGPMSTVASDIVSVGDSWLSFAIKNAIIEPVRGVEEQDWFKGLSDKWKVYLRRNHEGEIDPEGEIWAAPYRWGSMVIAYKKSKFQEHKLAPIEPLLQDWADLWRPELAGRISMVDSPREVVGSVLKYMGASYNTKNIDLQVPGGKNAVQQNLALLGKQVRLFDSMYYLKTFSMGDAWVAVGWSSDVLPIAKRMSNVAVVVPKSGTSLWADLWAIPAATKLETNQIGGRIRGPSPLIHQWIEFCLQAARALPFKQEVIPGATPSAIENSVIEVPKELTKGKPKLDTNLIAGVPPPEILTKCEFLEPLPDATLSDYKLLIRTMQIPDPGLIHRIQHYILSTIHTFRLKQHPKVA
ncbi:uncharacterized protein LOC133700547 isoform X1 [Populus nigra]|uniref:uncharacterized protein LOC133700547 isoform X1 n=1 Tax=Populus nigra TaxID=3691 RepID=UPI002B267E9E|nr:uncharacterized protein LOC133700547 isoform X1 [Populus nigra]